MGQVADTIRAKLAEAFAPTALDVIDDSERHAGHVGFSLSGESHFTVRITSLVFEGLSRLERQRRINGVLAEELKGRVHALSIKALSPDES
ncbi:MAG: BolA family protein [Caulobacteraceae bacterium]